MYNIVYEIMKCKLFPLTPICLVAFVNSFLETVFSVYTYFNLFSQHQMTAAKITVIQLNPCEGYYNLLDY